jgi:signal transduction histidine kinase
MQSGSLRLRLLLAGAVSIALALSLAGVALVALFERHVERRVAGELETELRQLVAAIQRAPDGALVVTRALAEPRFQTPLSGMYWQIDPPAGAPALRSRSLWDASLALPPDTLRRGQAHTHTLRGPGGARLLAIERSVSLPAHLGGAAVRVTVAVDRADISNAAAGFAADLAPSLVLLAAVLFLAAWAQVTIGLRPLDAIRRQLAQVRAGRAMALDGEFPDEVQPLAAEVNHLLAAQADELCRARGRAADLAHGLRTPLTVLAATAEDLRAAGNTAAAAEIVAITDVMRRHVEREMARARAGTASRIRTQAPVGPVAERVTAVLRKTPTGRALDWRIDIPSGLELSLDQQDLAEILGNLCDNAARFARHRVLVAGRRDDDATILLVEDDGRGIPDDKIEQALKRGGRLDQTASGSGLGLAIVADLAAAYGGSVRLDRSGLGGVRATLRFADTRRPG